MTATISTAESRKMPLPDLQRERATQKALVAKLKLGIALRKEKGTAQYRLAKRELARMETILAEKMRSGALPGRPKRTTVSPPKKP